MLFIHRLKFFLFFFFVFFLLWQVAPVSAQEVSGRVSWIYDGDTLKVDGIGKVRLIGIDTPESEAGSRDLSYQRRGISAQRLRTGAKRAIEYLILTAKGKVVTLNFDREKRDRYGRVLAYVSLPDGRMLNRELLREGLACVYRRFDFRLKEDFLAAESEAREGGRGLWAHD